MNVHTNWRVTNTAMHWFTLFLPTLSIAFLLLFYSNRSIDFSDESLYLYLTSNPSEEASLAGSWNWYLNMIYSSLGKDLAVYRQATIVLTFAATFMFSRAIFRNLKSPDNSVVFDLTNLLNTALTTGAAIFFYRYFLLTPGYNWLAFIGILFALTGALHWLDQSKSPMWPVVTLCGLGLATMGRPFSGFFIFLVMMSNELIRNDFLKFRRNGKIFIGTLFAYLIIHHLFILSISTTINNWRQITLVSQSESDYSISNLALEFARELVTLPINSIAVSYGLIAVPLIAIASTLVNKDKKPKKIALAASVAALIAFQVLLLIRGTYKYSQETSSELGSALVTIVLFGILCSYLMSMNTHILSENENARADEKNFKKKYILLVSGIIAYSFSSNNGMIKQSIGIGVLYVAIYLLSISKIVRGRLGEKLIVANAVLLIAALGQVAIGALQNPYRSDDIIKNTYPVVIRDKGILYVSKERASDINAINLIATQLGSSVNDSYLVDLSPFTTFVTHQLGFKTIETPLLINSQYLTEFARRNDAILQQAWILTSDSDNSLDVNVLLVELEKTLDKDYELVTVLQGRYCRNSECELSLWKPI
jgi:hypothetical protein